MISFDKGLVVACKCFEYNLITVFFFKLRVKHLQISSSSEAGRTVFTLPYFSTKVRCWEQRVNVPKTKSKYILIWVIMIKRVSN